MKLRSLFVFLVVLPVLFGAGDTGTSNTRNRTPGKITGSYAGTVAGDYTGTTGASVTSTSVTINATIKLPNGNQIGVYFGNMPLNNKRFSGAAFTGTGTIFITGRVDLPAATDDQQTDQQAITARITANITDTMGKTSGRVVCIQDIGSRGVAPGR